MKRLLVALWSATTLAGARAETYDLVVYGGTSAGVAAAVQAKRMGASVVVVEPSRRVGGMTTNGLGQTDIGNKHVIGGIAREFYREVRRWYARPEAWRWQPRPKSFGGDGQSVTTPGEDTQWTFEPSAALAIYQRWLTEAGVPVVLGQRLARAGEAKVRDAGGGFHVAPPGTVSAGVVREGGRIRAVVMESGRRFEGRMFLDATYEGDLMAGAGVSYTVGREGRAVYGETANGVRATYVDNDPKWSNQVRVRVDPYVRPGDPASGLLPGIDPRGPGEEHAGDARVQAYNLRLCLTDHPDNRNPVAKPAGYDEAWFEPLLRAFEAGLAVEPWNPSPMPNRKTDANNMGGLSTDFIGQNYGWPEGSYAEREEIYRRHLLYTQGLLWTLGNHPRVPERIRTRIGRWGVTRDEFTETGGWQRQLYVREARRMVADVVMAQGHCEGKAVAADPVGMGAYNMDSHNVQRYVTADGRLRNEGDIQIGVTPYPISFRAIVPRPSECENLVVPVALSASHIAFGSIRMEPVFMILGQSAATAAVHAIHEGRPVQAVDPGKLRARLLADGQVLERPGR